LDDIIADALRQRGRNRECKMTVVTKSPKIIPEAQLRSFIEKFDAKNQKIFRSLRSAVRKRLAAANELVYDYESNLVIGYSPTERPTDGILSIGLRHDGVRLYFINGKRLSDPKKLLKGSGKQTRFVPIEAARQLKQPDIETLIVAEIENAVFPLPSDGRGKLIIRSVSANTSPRRKSTTK
jgi:hypothetical protein